MTGGFNYSPQTFGDSADTVCEIFLKALNQANGDGLTDEIDSFVYAKNFATARVLADLWSDNARLSYQFDPNKMTDFLPRWETILNIIPDPDATDNERRNVVAAKLSNYGKAATQQVVNDLMVAILGDIFVQILNSDYTIASGGIPGGATVPGGAVLLDEDWHSTIAYIAILLQQPANMPDYKFYIKAGNIDAALEDLLPAWTSFAWVRNNSNDTAGFILDDEHNLDNEYFD